MVLGFAVQPAEEVVFGFEGKQNGFWFSFATQNRRREKEIVAEVFRMCVSSLAPPMNWCGLSLLFVGKDVSTVFDFSRGFSFVCVGERFDKRFNHTAASLFDVPL